MILDKNTPHKTPVGTGTESDTTKKPKAYVIIKDNAAMDDVAKGIMLCQASLIYWPLMYSGTIFTPAEGESVAEFAKNDAGANLTPAERKTISDFARKYLIELPFVGVDARRVGSVQMEMLREHLAKDHLLKIPAAGNNDSVHLRDQCGNWAGTKDVTIISSILSPCLDSQTRAFIEDLATY